MRRFLVRFAESRAVLGVLLTLLAVVAYRWFVIQQSFIAPKVPGWNWTEHPDTVLIVYRPDCGCSLQFPSMIDSARTNGKDTVVITALHGTETIFSGIQRTVAEHRSLLVCNISPQIIRDLSPSGRTTVYPVKNGRFEGRSEIDLPGATSASSATYGVIK